MDIRTDAPPLRFISIIPQFLHRPEYLATLIKERLERTGITDYALSYPLHPQGDDVMAKVYLQAELFRELKPLVSHLPIRLGILFQSLIGHGGPWANTPGKFNIQRLVQPNGQTSIRCCPADPVFRDYVRQAVTTLVKEGPDFALTDDDLRLSDMTCMCERHLHAVSQRMGHKYTREELVAELENAKPHAKISAVFEEVMETSTNDLCRIVREAIDSVNPKLACGCCIIGSRLDYAEKQLNAVRGSQTTETFMRLSNSQYREGPIKDLCRVMATTGYQVINLRHKGFDLLDESDTCPHNRFSKTARTMHLHITSALFQGLDGGKLWFDQSSCPMREISRPYEDIFGKHQGFYRELHRLVSQWKPMGLFTPIPGIDREPLPHKGTIYSQIPDWNNQCYAKCGFPTFYERFDYEGIRLLSGGQIDYFTDDELKIMLSGKAIVDSPAALELTQRGFSDLTGVTASDRPYEVSSETGLSDTWRTALGSEGPFLCAADDATVLTTAQFIPYAGAPQTTVMPGSVYYRNRLGGQVITSALALAKTYDIRYLNPARKLQYIAWLQRLGGVPAFLPDMQDLKLYCGKLPDGSLLCGIFNFSYDPFPVRITLACKPHDILQLAPEGDFKPVSHSWEASTALLNLTLQPAELAVVKII